LFLDQIDIAAEDPGQSLAESLQPTEVIESPGRKPCTRPDGQIHVGRAGGVATRKRAKQRNCFNALRPEFRLMRPWNSQQLGARSWVIGHVPNVTDERPKSERDCPRS
jgi:hypothetical protein